MSAARLTKLSMLPPLVAGEQPERNADGSLDGDGEHADGERDARAIEDRAQEIAPLRVGAEQEARIAPLAPPGRKLGIEHVEAREIERIVRGDEGRQHRGKRDSPEQDRGNARAGILDGKVQHSARGVSSGPSPHRVPSRLMRGSSMRLAMSTRVLTRTKRNPTATR